MVHAGIQRGANGVPLSVAFGFRVKPGMTWHADGVPLSAAFRDSGSSPE